MPTDGARDHRRRPARARYLRPALLSVLAIAALWLVLVRGYADYMARIQPQRALAINARQPAALVRLAEAALVEERLAEAEGYARRAIAVAPLEGRAFRVLGAVRDLAGKGVEAASLMQVAARLSPRDTPTQFWLVLQAIKNRDIDAALARVDRLLRFQPETLAQMMPLMTTIASNPAGARPLARLLSDSPEWRGSFFAEFARSAPTSTHLAMFVNALRRAGSELTEAESATWIQRLATERDWPRLKRVLTRNNPERKGILLGDGDFERPAIGAFSGWSLQSSPGIELQVTQRSARDADHALRIEFFDQRAQIQGLEQWLLLDAGRYRFNGEARLQALVAERGLDWSIRCIPDNVVLGQSELLVGERAWAAFQFDFEVPAKDCGAQVLKLEVSARIAAEQQVKGVAWFDKLSITRLAVSAGP